MATVRFVRAAADHGLEVEQAVRLAVEHELVLGDADELGVTREMARHVLTTAATAARPQRPLSARQAAYVRGLSLVRPRRSTELLEASVALPCRLLTRTAGRIRTSAFDAAMIGEMIAWERAAALEGRTMAEWALKLIAAAGRAGSV